MMNDSRHELGAPAPERRPLATKACPSLMGLVALLFASVPLVGQGVDLRRGVEEIAAQLGDRVPRGQTLTVAVADFPDLGGSVSDLGRFVAERLTTELSLAANTFRVIERRRLVNVIEELKINMSELVDPNHVREIGRMIGAEALVTGTISDLGNVVDLDARLVMIETSEVLPGARVGISRDQVVNTLMKQGVTMAAASAGGSGAPPSQRRADAVEPVTRFRNQYFEVEAISAEWRDGAVEFYFFFRNKTDERMRVTLYDDTNRTYAVDDAGIRHPLINPTRDTQTDFGPQIRERVRIVFGEFKERPVSVTVVLYMWFSPGRYADVMLRDIGVTG